MPYSESDVSCVEDELESTAHRHGEFGYRAPDTSESARLLLMAKNEQEALKKDFRELQAEARHEFKAVRAKILQEYEDRLNEAKRQYLEDAVASREKLQLNRQLAREEYEEALRNAKIDYEFAVDVVKDHYQTMQRETTRTIKLKEAAARTDALATEDPVDRRATTRVMERLDEEIRRITAKKEKAREEAGLG